jgi:hypothetical protein
VPGTFFFLVENFLCPVSKRTVILICLYQRGTNMPLVAISSTSNMPVKGKKRGREADEKLDTHRRVAESVKSALSGGLLPHKFKNTKGRMTMDVGNVDLHFEGNECLPLQNASELTFLHHTPAYDPESEHKTVGQSTVGLEFHVANIEVENNFGFMRDLPKLSLITCTTPTDTDDVRVELWSDSKGMLGTRGFAVNPWLQATQDPYAPATPHTRPHCSGDPDFVEHPLGNVMQFKLQSTSCLSFTLLPDGKWKLSGMWLF